jgi:flavin-dependent dehydrogenase
MPEPATGKSRFDVIIIGGRCSGATLAAYLARAGASVLVIERDPRGADCILSTHTLHPPAIAILDEVGVGEKMRQVTPASRVIRIRKGAVSVDLSYPDGQAEYCPRRFHLDALLQQAAQEAGAEFLDRTNATRLLRDGGRVCGVEAEGPGGPQRFQANVVIGADGRFSLVAEQAGAREYLGYDAPRAMYWAYYDAPARWKNDSAFNCDFYLGHDAGVHSVFQTDHGQLLIGTMPSVEEARGWRANLPRAFLQNLREDPFTAALVEDARMDGKIRGTLRERYYFREAAGAGWALAGDAGHHKEFVIGDGITEALIQVKALAAAIQKGTDAALAAWWRWRDVEAWEMHCFGQDEGALHRPIELQEAVLRRVERSQPLKDSMAMVFERRVSPYEAVPVSTVLAAVGSSLLQGRWEALTQFLEQGKRIRSVKNQLREFQDRLAAAGT